MALTLTAGPVVRSLHPRGTEEIREQGLHVRPDARTPGCSPRERGAEGVATGHKEEGACVGAPSVGSSRVERGEVTTVNVIGVSLPPQRVWGHLHKYCLQNAVSGSATCSEAATCTFPGRSLGPCVGRLGGAASTSGSSPGFLGDKLLLVKRTSAGQRLADLLPSPRHSAAPDPLPPARLVQTEGRGAWLEYGLRLLVAPQGLWEQTQQLTAGPPPPTPCFPGGSPPG